MMGYLVLIPIAIVIIYGMFLMSKYKKLSKAVVGLMIITVSLVIYLVISKYLTVTESLLILLVFVTSIVFFLLSFDSNTSILFMIVFIFTLGLILYLGLSYQKLMIQLSFIIASIFVLAQNNLSMIRKSYEEEATEYQNKIFDKQISEVQNIYLTMRSWRHDYHNHLQKLKAHISMNQIKEANEYLNELEID